MKKIVSVLMWMLTMNAAAQGIPTYEHLEPISFPQTQDYVEALVEDLKRPADCRLNNKRLPFTEVQTVFKVTIGDRLRLLLKKDDIAKLYFEDFNPAFLITTLHESADKTQLYDELRFRLTDDEKKVRNIEFDQYSVKEVKVNEGTLRKPQVVTKTVLEPKLKIRCAL